MCFKVAWYRLTRERGAATSQAVGEHSKARMAGRTRRRREREPRVGFVLVMSLAIILLAGFLLAGIARHSLDAALEAIEARRDLQGRWGTISCQHLVLDRADQIFADLQTTDSSSASFLSSACAPRMRIELGEMVFDLHLADENCKVNLNTIYAIRDEEDVVRICRDSSTALRVELRPCEPDDNAAAFRAWSQVFAPADDDSKTTPPQLLADAAVAITCWGDGRVNIRRAPDNAVQTVASLVVSKKAAKELVSIRAKYPDATLNDWLKALSVSRDEADKLAQVFSEESMCYSLWINCRGAERSWHELVIRESSADEADRISRFHW